MISSKTLANSDLLFFTQTVNPWIDYFELCKSAFNLRIFGNTYVSLWSSWSKLILIWLRRTSCSWSFYSRLACLNLAYFNSAFFVTNSDMHSWIWLHKGTFGELLSLRGTRLAKLEQVSIVCCLVVRSIFFDFVFNNYIELASGRLKIR